MDHWILAMRKSSVTLAKVSLEGERVGVIVVDSRLGRNKFEPLNVDNSD